MQPLPLASSLVFVLLAAGCSCESAPAAPDAALPDAALPDAALPDAADLPDAPPADAGPLPFCRPSEIAMRGELGGVAIDRRDRFSGTTPSGVGAGSPIPPLWLDTNVGGELLLLSGPMPSTQDEWAPVRGMFRTGDDHFYCAGDRTRVRRTATTLELELRDVRDLGTCDAAPPIAGTISGCDDSVEGFCLVESTIPGESFRHDDVIGGLLTVGSSRRLLSFELRERRERLWAWLEGGELQTAFFYVPSEDGTDAHVYCATRVDATSDRDWELADLRDLGSCSEAPEIEGEVDTCVESARSDD